jgi:hypothetical protein
MQAGRRKSREAETGLRLILEWGSSRDEDNMGKMDFMGMLMLGKTKERDWLTHARGNCEFDFFF